MYELRRPAGPLRDHVEHYWFVAPSDGELVDLRVDAFVDARADLIFNFGAPYRRKVIGGEAREVDRSNFDAQRLYPIRIVQRGDVRVLGVRFRLGGVAPFTAVPLSGLTGEIHDPDAVFDDAARLEGALTRTEDPDAAARLLDDFLLARLAAHGADPRFAEALAVMETASGRIPATELAALAGVSLRHLERTFARRLGVPPQTLARVLRFQHALRSLMVDPGSTLDRVATDAGYFDQAHFIRDFRRFSGGVPRGYRGYYPPDGPRDFAPNVVVFVQDDAIDSPSH